MRKILLLMCALLAGASGAWAEVTTPTFVNATATSLSSGWYQIKWVSANGATTTYTDSELEGKFVTNYAQDVTVSEKYYPLYLGSAPSTAQQHALTFVYFNPTSNISGSGKFGSLLSANGRYIQIDGSSSLSVPATESAIVVVSGGKPEVTITSGGQYASERYSLIPLGKDDVPYIGQTGNKIYPKVLISSVNLGTIGLTAWHVIINGLNESLANDNTQITYSGSGVYGLSSVYNNGTFFVDSDVTPTESDLSVPSKVGYASNTTIDTSAKTITVTYTTTYTYTLTDVNGQEYTGSLTGEMGATPTLSGCDGCSLDNEVWDYENKTYTADIIFPFSVSSNSKTNWTYIGGFEGKSNYTSDNFLWHASESSIITYQGYAPNNTYEEGQYTENNKYKWSILPTITNGNITFTIKNAYAGYYIYNSSGTTLTLNNSSATDFVYVSYGSKGQYAWKKVNTSYFCSLSSVDGKPCTMNLLATEHDGISVNFYTPADFAALETALSSAKTYYDNRSAYIGTGLNLYTYEGEADAQTHATAILNRTETATAKQITAYTTTLNSIVINEPATNAFYRIKGYSRNYITDKTAGSNAAMNGTKSIDNIIYYNASKNIIFYSSGLGLYQTHTVAPVGSTLNVFTFKEGAQVCKYYLQSDAKTYNSSLGEYCYDNTNADPSKLDRNGNPVTSGSYQTDWTLEEVTSLPVTLSSIGFSTFYSPVALTVPAGLTAYVGEINGDRLTLTPTTVIPANQGVILQGTANQSYDLTIGGSSNLESSISGSAATVTRASVGEVLTLTSNEGQPVFRSYTGDNLDGFKGYIPAGDLSVKALTIDFYTDAISALQAEKMQGEQRIYDLNGRRVERIQHGVYIVNGRKLVIK